MALEKRPVYRKAPSPSCRQLEPCRPFFKTLMAMVVILKRETTEDNIPAFVNPLVRHIQDTTQGQEGNYHLPRMTTGCTLRWLAPVLTELQTSHSHRPSWWCKRGTLTHLAVMLHSFFTKHCKLQLYNHSLGFGGQVVSCISLRIMDTCGETRHGGLHFGNTPILKVTPTVVPMQPHTSRRSYDQDY